jgi:hypothetical protein
MKAINTHRKQSGFFDFGLGLGLLALFSGTYMDPPRFAR